VTTLNSPGSLGTASIEDDADNPGENVLIVTGTNKNDVIVVEPQPKSHGIFRVVQNKKVIVTFISTEVPRIVVFGLAGNDTIVVNGSMTQSAKLFGDAGNDVIKGARGNDEIDGGDGNDKLYGYAGNDLICGGRNNDFIFGGLGNDTIGGDNGNDKLYGEAGNDLIMGADGNDFLYGSAGNDRLYGQAGNDQLFGDAGNDLVVGGDGNDKLFGSAGRDVLIGRTGKDTLYGESGEDLLISDSTANDEDDAALQALLAAWAANDTFANRVANIGTFAGPDAITDDGVADTLYGGSNQDWFIVGSNDKIKDRAKNEPVN